MAEQLQTIPNLPESLLWDRPTTAKALSISERTLRAREVENAVPGRVVLGGRVLFSAAVLRAWCAAGCPAAKTWLPNAAEVMS